MTTPPARRLTAAAARAAGLLAFSTLLAVPPCARAATVTWLGAQYTPGPGYPSAWPAAGSYFDPANWQGNALPASADTALFGPLQPLPNGNTTNAPHIIHFGNFGYYGTTIIPGGTATLAAATLAQDSWTFDFASGQNPDFTGTLTPSTGALTIGTLALAPTAGQTASLTIQNGTLTSTALLVASQAGSAILNIAPGAYAKSTTVTIGIGATGSVAQSGGTHSISGKLTLGSASGIAGVYYLSDGVLATTGGETLGDQGSGTFLQTGGTHTASGGPWVVVGSAAGAGGTYVLSGGLFSAASGEALGNYSGAGSFLQTGGTHTVSNQLILGQNANASGYYNLIDGTLTSVSTYVGFVSAAVATFTQSGGTHTSSSVLSIGASGRYELTGGTLQLDGGLANAGSLVFGATATVTAGGIIDLGNVTVQDQNQVNFTLAANSLLLLPTGFATSKFGTFTNNGGIIASVDGPVTIPAGSLVNSGSVTCRPMLICEGTLTGKALLNGIQVQGIAPSATAGSLGVSSGASGISSGQLTIPTETIGSGGTFTQSGGSHTISASLTVSASTGSIPSYVLGGGQLSTGELYLGNGGKGSFTQTAGTHTIPGRMYIGYSGSWMNLDRISGVYTLEDGLLASTQEFIGAVGSGTFVQTGGTHSIYNVSNWATSYLAIGWSAVGVGTYVLTAGQLSAPTEWVGGDAGSGTFLQSGGTHTVTGTLTLAYSRSTANGLYNLTNGQLSAGAIVIGNGNNGTGTFSMSSGQVAASRMSVITGNFTQTGGTTTVSGSLNIATTGLFSLTGGTLQVGSLTNAGSMTLGGAATLIASGVLDLTGATALDVSQFTITSKTNSLVFLPPGDFGTINNAGVTFHVQGTSIIPAGTLVALGTRNLNSNIYCYGSLTSSGTLSGAVQVQGSGIATLKELRVESPFGGLSGGQISGTLESIGYSGTGIFTQTGGTHTLSAVLWVGYNAGSAGTYSLSSGQLTSQFETVGYSGNGTFVQSGGTHTVPLDFYLGREAGAIGIYALSGGQLTTRGYSENLGYSGTGSFSQSGGTHTNTTTLCLGYNSGGAGVYSLSDGVLSGVMEYVGLRGAGTFTQTGGTHTNSDALSIGASGRYSLTGGTLQLTGGLDNAGSLVLGGAGTLNARGLVDLSHATAQDLSQFTLTLAAQSLLVLPATMPTTAFGSFTNNGGLVASADGPVSIPTGAVVVAGSVTYPTMLICEGSLTGIAKLNAIQVQGTTASATAYSLQMDSGDSSISGGQLTVTTESIGYNHDAVFTQSGGTHTVLTASQAYFYLGYNSGVTGSYVLSNGQIKTNFEYLGYSGRGVFTQTGGTHTVGGYLIVGEYGTGVYTQLNGSHTISARFTLASRPGSSGTYTLSGGYLLGGVEELGYAGAATFTQSGGTHSIPNDLTIGVLSGASGTYVLSDTGIMSAACVYLGGSNYAAGGAGTLSISGGTATVSNFIKLWNTAGTTLALSGGTLSVKTLDLSLNPSAFSWTGGVLQITGTSTPSLTVPAAGTFKGATTVSGSLTNNGTVAPGASPGLLTVQGNYTQSPLAALQIEIGGKSASLFDRLVVQGNVDLEGSIAVTLLGGFSPAPGDSFDVLDWTGTLTDRGCSFDFSHASLPDGLAWDASAFSATGQLSIIQAVPEPATLALLTLAAPFLLTRRRPASPAVAEKKPRVGIPVAGLKRRDR